MARHLTLVEWGLWMLAVTVLVLDVVTTYHGLQQGLTELNPIARAAIGTFGLAAMGPMKLMALGVAVVGWKLLPSNQRVFAPLALALPWTVAVLTNAGLLAA